jgi:hypothetical protein
MRQRSSSEASTYEAASNSQPEKASAKATVEVTNGGIMNNSCGGTSKASTPATTGAEASSKTESPAIIERSAFARADIIDTSEFAAAGIIGTSALEGAEVIEQNVGVRGGVAEIIETAASARTEVTPTSASARTEVRSGINVVVSHGLCHLIKKQSRLGAPDKQHSLPLEKQQRNQKQKPAYLQIYRHKTRHAERCLHATTRPRPYFKLKMHTAWLTAREIVQNGVRCQT